MDGNADRTAEHAIEQLETRLCDIEYVLLGQRREAADKEDIGSVEKRIMELERSLDKLATKSRSMQDLLKLQEYLPEFFHPPLSDDMPCSLDHQSKVAIVLASTRLFPDTATQLILIRDTPPPDTEVSSQVILKIPQAERVKQLQESQSREIAILKERSAAVLQRWYALDILQTGACWADLEDRAEKVELSLRQAALANQSG